MDKRIIIRTEKQLRNEIKPRKKGWKLLPVFVVLTVTFLIYSPVLSVGMIADDFLHTVNISRWDDIWREQGGWTFRFVGNFIFWLDGVVWGGNFAGRHLGSIIIQLCSISFAYLISRRMFAERTSAILCTAIYAFHFGNVSSVAWPADKWTLSAATFFLAGFYFALRYFDNPTRLNLSGAALSCGLGLLTKEVVIMLVPVLILFQWTRGISPRLILQDSKLRRFYIILGFILTCYLVYRFGFASKVARQGFAIGGTYDISFMRALLGFPFYISYSFFPYDYFELFRLDPEAIRMMFKSQLTGPIPYVVFGFFSIAMVAVIFKTRKFWDGNMLFGVGWFLAIVMTFVFWFDVRWLNPTTFGVAIFYTSVAERSGLLSLGHDVSSQYPRIFCKRLLKAMLLFGVVFLFLISSMQKIHRWVENGNLVQSILHQTKDTLPVLKPNSLIVFLNLPDLVNMTHVFRNGIEQALRNEYRDPSLNVVYNSIIFEGIISQNKFCEYALKYKFMANTTRINGGEAYILYFEPNTQKVNRYQCNDF